jgi:hypothetical protein
VLQPTHSLNNEVSSAFQGEDLRLGTEDVHTHRTVCLGEQPLPLLDSAKDEGNELSLFELSASGINPDHRLGFFRTKEDHVVVRRHDDLVRALGVTENRFVTGTSRWSFVPFMTDMARLDS